MPRKKAGVRQLKRKLDGIFSKFIRLRDADAAGYANCCSCGNFHQWKEMDAGHYISRQHNSTRYDERNVHAQCRKCNRYDEGNKSGYSLFLIQNYGKDIIAMLDRLGHETKSFRALELEALIVEYKGKLKGLG